MSENDTATTSSVERVECPATKDTAVRRFIFAALLIGFGIWCYLDRGKYAEPGEDINQMLGYYLNHYGLFVLGPVGLAILVLGVLSLRKVLVADAEGLGYRGGEKTPWEELDDIDASEIKKGYLYIDRVDGTTITLDQYKLQNFKELVGFIEDHAPESAKMTAEEDSAEPDAEAEDNAPAREPADANRRTPAADDETDDDSDN